jgi:signal transduction histidine kinase
MAPAEGRAPQAPVPGEPDGATAAGSANGARSAPPATGRSSRRALKNWHVRSRLLLLIIIPTLAAIGLGGFSIASSIRSAESYQRVSTLATLGQRVAVLAQSLEDERDLTAGFIQMGAAGGRGSKGQQFANEQAVIAQAYQVSDRAAAQLKSVARQVNDSYAVEAQQAAQTALTALDGLDNLRSAATGTKLPVLVVVNEYTTVINDVLALDDQISQAASDPQLAQTVRALSLVSAMQESASEQRAILFSALWAGRFGPGQLAALQNAESAQQSNLSTFTASASVGELRQWTAAANAADPDASAQEAQAIALGGSLRGDATTPSDWYGAMSNTVDQKMGSVTKSLAATAASRADVLRNSAIRTALIVGAAVVIALLLALVFTTIVGRSMVRPLRRLRAGALEVAGLRLPDAVRQMNESDGASVSLDVEPIDVDSTDEIGEVARAFDQVHREALRLASNEAQLRGNVNAMFVNLSRRSQSLVERQIRLIDDLEQGEQDEERLGSLFRMDHLATRMRRNSENLLVLAGHDSSRRWNQPVALVDVLRAAVSEIEQYERVSLNVQPGISVRGHAVNDTVHLLAELAENATSFSSAETPVTVSGHLLSSGGVLLDITDQGVGMGAEEMAHANWRLDNPPVVDVAVSRRMGLFVVARLAARHGIRVRLRPAGSGGLTALVWLPDEVISRDGSSSAAPMTDGVGDLMGGPSLPSLASFNAAGQQVDERAATAQEVSASRTPKFASLHGDVHENGHLGPRRVPGIGPHPGNSHTAPAVTGPLPAFRTSPQPSDEPDDEPFATAPQRAVDPATGPVPAVDHDPFAGWPDPPGAEQAGPAAAAPAGPSALTTGNGQQLPKRVVEHRDSGDGAGARGSTDMFSRPAGGGSDLFRRPSPAEPAVPAEPPAQPAASASGMYSAPAATDFSALDTGFGVQDTDAVAPAGGTNGSGGGPSGFGWDTGPSGDDVVVPPAEQTQEYRLPIFEAVESDWFRRGRSSVGWSQEAEAEAPAQTGAWSSPADSGWQAAAAAAAPSSAGTTTAGLPKRVPKANLVPGTASSEPAAPQPARSASATRDRFASFQRGVKEGRAAATGSETKTGEDDGSR